MFLCIIQYALHNTAVVTLFWICRLIYSIGIIILFYVKFVQMNFYFKKQFQFHIQVI